MELQNTQLKMPVQPVQQAAPPPAQPDGRVTADAAAISKNPRPDVPLPIPASPSQTGLVSKSALPDEAVSSKIDDAGISAIQRTLKPYGINMLPETQDAPKQEAPPETQAK